MRTNLNVIPTQENIFSFLRNQFCVYKVVESTGMNYFSIRINRSEIMEQDPDPTAELQIIERNRKNWLKV